MKKRILTAVLTVFASAVLMNGVSVWADAEGTVLNIYAWNEELKNRMEDHYPGYKTVDESTGKIGDVTVSWSILSGSDYQNSLDKALEKNEEIDLFLVEADYAGKYAGMAMQVADLGITEEDLALQFEYTKKVVQDSEGIQRGVAWQSCPGLLIYRRDIAKEVLGTDDPEKVQEYLSDWECFSETAGKMQEAGYLMTACADDLYSVFTNRDITGRTEDEDDGELEWNAFTEKMLNAGQTNAYEMWSEEWKKGLYTDGKVFCYFGPAWFYEYSMDSEEEGSVGFDGGWAVTEGPQPFFLGGTWLCCAKGTDNPTLAGEIMRNLTCNTEIMTDMAKADGDFVNNTEVMEMLAAEESFFKEILGGQNPISLEVSTAIAIP